jgi:DNA modification methylase
MITLYNNDCLKVLKEIKEKSIDAIVTDPPYEINHLKNDWDKTGIAYSIELWTELKRVLKPGGYMAVFGFPKTVHRVTCAIEDAGFEIRDNIHWCYSSGFPKSKKVSIPGFGTNLKPSYEPIILARRKFSGSNSECIERYGVGALNIDGCRVPGVIEGNPNRFATTKGGSFADFKTPPVVRTEGRWPPNLLLSHTLECEEAACSYDCPVQEMDAQSKGASKYFPVFKYQAKASKKERGADNIHPTVKPIALMEWLIRLVTPPKGIILDPFMGSGSTGVAAVNEKISFIGIELEEKFYNISKKRVYGVDNPAESIEDLFSY